MSEEPALRLYRGEPQHEVFPHMDRLFPTGELQAAEKPRPFPAGASIELPESYTWQGEERRSEAFLADTDTSALLVLQDGRIRFEQYYLTGGQDVQWTSWSTAKSFISALIGIALDEGFIASIDDPISQYIPAVVGSAYEGVAIRHVLQMSSGAAWNEDYSDSRSDVNRLGKVMAGEQTLESFVAGIRRANEPGTICQYNSADTQVLGLLLVAATGRSITSYMQEKLMVPLGMESRGYWLLDSAGMELALGGLNLTARDFAKLGELFRLGGCWAGEQIVPKSWIELSTRIDGDHLMPGKPIVGGHGFPFGYGYQWWIPESDCGEFSAIGVYNQFIYVDPSRDVVIVKLSANRRYGVSEEEADNRDEENMVFIQHVARSLVESKS